MVAKAFAEGLGTVAVKIPKGRSDKNEPINKNGPVGYLNGKAWRDKLDSFSICFGFIVFEIKFSGKPFY